MMGRRVFIGQEQEWRSPGEVRQLERALELTTFAVIGVIAHAHLTRCGGQSRLGASPSSENPEQVLQIHPPFASTYSCRLPSF